MSGLLVLVVAAWGVAEATVFFVVPDLAIGWVALRRPRMLPAAWLAATAGGVVGAAATYTLVRRGWDPDSVFAALPGVRPGDRARVQREVSEDPVRAFVVGAVSGVPVKFHVAEAAREGIPLSRTLVLVALNRAPRIGVMGLLLAGMAAAGRRAHLDEGVVAVLYALGWAAFYGWYWVLRGNGDEGAAEGPDALQA